MWRRRYPSAERVSVGLLGADYEVTPEGYYRIQRIYPGQNWHPELRAPLTEPGVNVQEGDYLLAVNGQAAARAHRHLQPVRKDRRTDHRPAGRPDT